MSRIEWDGVPVAIENWAKDHWSTFAYVEVRTVDHKGFVDDRNLRGHRDGWDRYPTRLKGGVELYGHNDYDCIRDAVVAGLLVYADPEEVTFRRGWDATGGTGADGRDTSPNAAWRGDRLALTALGRDVAGQLRGHKGQGGRFATFEPVLTIPVLIVREVEIR